MSTIVVSIGRSIVGPCVALALALGCQDRASSPTSSRSTGGDEPPGMVADVTPEQLCARRWPMYVEFGLVDENEPHGAAEYSAFGCVMRMRLEIVRMIDGIDAGMACEARAKTIADVARCWGVTTADLRRRYLFLPPPPVDGHSARDICDAIVDLARPGPYDADSRFTHDYDLSVCMMRMSLVYYEDEITVPKPDYEAYARCLIEARQVKPCNEQLGTEYWSQIDQPSMHVAPIF